MDTYPNFRALRQNEARENYCIYAESRASGIVIIAPHGGGIEQGTLEIARSVAGEEHSFYGFEGLKSTWNEHLHITSTSFDEPKCLRLVRISKRVVAIHGCEGNRKNVYIGGRDEGLKQHISQYLRCAGFEVGTHGNDNLQGNSIENICNRGLTGAGVQLELEKGLRKSMFGGLNRQERNTTTETFTIFVRALRDALADLQSSI